jgi:hypothetical protein
MIWSGAYLTGVDLTGAAIFVVYYCQHAKLNISTKKLNTIIIEELKLSSTVVFCTSKC